MFARVRTNPTTTRLNPKPITLSVRGSVSDSNEVHDASLLSLAFAATDGQSDNHEPLQVPAKSLPVSSDVSPEMQQLSAAPRNPNWDHLWKTGKEWRKAADEQAAKAVQALPAVRKRLHVSVKTDTIDGARVYIVPDVIPPADKSKLLIHVHGGCYVLFPAESGTSEAIMMAGFGHFKVISVDQTRRHRPLRGSWTVQILCALLDGPDRPSQADHTGSIPKAPRRKPKVS